MTTESTSADDATRRDGSRLSEGLGVTREDLECQWRPSEKDLKTVELAERYHYETEAYDRTVCTGPVVRGSVMPIGPHEMAMVNRNAIKVRAQIMAEAAAHGISQQDMARAIGRHA